MNNQILKILIISSFFLFFAFSVQAANPLDTVINEIAWMGTKVEGIESKNWWRYEWLELYNNINQPIFLNGWKIELYRTDLDWTLELNGVIGAQNYFLIVASDKIFPNYDLNYSNLRGKFINSGQKVLLKDKDGKIIDEIDCFSGWFAGDNSTKQTMERKNPLAGSDPTNWQTSQNPGGTPKAKNSVATVPESKTKPGTQPAEDQQQEEAEPEPLPSEALAKEGESESSFASQSGATEDKPKPVTYPSGIVINEILPSPEGPDAEEEWIEIFNQNNFEVNLFGWQIVDTAGSTKTYTFPEGTKIRPNGFLVLSRPTTKITLNNSGDGLKLIQPDGNVLDNVSYEKAPRGQSYNRLETSWAWSAILTPRSANIVPSPTLDTKATKPASSEEPQEAPTQKELAAAGLQIPKSPRPLYIFLIAFGVAVASGTVILFLKKRLKLVNYQN